MQLTLSEHEIQMICEALKAYYDMYLFGEYLDLKREIERKEADQD